MTNSIATIELTPPEPRVFKETEYSKIGLVHLRAFNLMVAEPNQIVTAHVLKTRLGVHIQIARRILNGLQIEQMIEKVAGVEGGFQLSDLIRQNHIAAIKALDSMSMIATRRANSIRIGGSY
jgi:DNA-binding IscR family transcriptional regulator